MESESVSLDDSSNEAYSDSSEEELFKVSHNIDDYWSGPIAALYDFIMAIGPYLHPCYTKLYSGCRSRPIATLYDFV